VIAKLEIKEQLIYRNIFLRFLNVLYRALQ
jgi:hypothetical protein